jgi:hypothetical protein
MSALRRLLLASGAWLVCSGAGAAALNIVDACAAQAAADARGIVALETACPGLEAALRETGVVSNLPEGWRESLDSDALHDLGALAHRYLDMPAQAGPDQGALRAILDELAREQVNPRKSWWDATKDWLRSWFVNREDNTAPWLERFIERLAQSADLVKVIAYVLLGLVVVAAVLFVINELRIAGVLSRRKQRGIAVDGAVVSRSEEVVPGLADLDAASLSDQPAILLRLLVMRMLANGALPAARNLTHRELVTSATFADVKNGVRFARISQLAERVLYGGGKTDADDARAVVADGRSLLLQLQAPEAARP